MPAINVEEAHQEFRVLKDQNLQRNLEYYLNRQAVQGNFQWPRNWPVHMPRIKHNLCKPITARFASYLMGKGFSFNLDRPNTLHFRDQAERTEKILRRLFKLSDSKIQFMAGAHSGSVTGRTIYKVYKTGPTGSEHACFTMVQPDYFYGIPARDAAGNDFAVVYYSYPLDILEAKRLFGDRPYKTEAAAAKGHYYQPLAEDYGRSSTELLARRRVPVLEVWTKDSYMLEVGEQVVFNGDNPYKDTETKEGFIPFVVIENIRNEGKTEGESDINQAREINEELNYLLSRKQYLLQRWLIPTVVWEGAPQNYNEILLSAVGGGGAIPTRLGARISFLSYDRPNPAVQEQEQALRTAILESAGINDIALQGTVHGSVNTGPALSAMYQPVISTIEDKRLPWEAGLEKLCRYLLAVQEDIGESDALGLAVVNASTQSENNSDGELVQLSGLDIAGLREVTISWPSIMPTDEIQLKQFELQKASQGFQSIYTTLEKTGEDYPDDEIARIRMENQDPSLRGQAVAEQKRAEASMMGAQAQQQQADTSAPPPGPMDQSGAPPDTGGPPAPDDKTAAAQGDIGARLRELARNRPQLDMSGDQPVIGSPGAAGQAA